MPTDALYLPSDIPFIQVELTGYAASANSDTALKPTGIPECERMSCGLRGDRVPDLLGGYEAMRRAAEIATELQEAEEWRGAPATAEGMALGYVFQVSVSGGIAVPPPRLAAGLERGTVPHIWERLRPHAESNELQGIDLPVGRIIFRDAQACGHYKEQLMVSVPSLRPFERPQMRTTGGP